MESVVVTCENSEFCSSQDDLPDRLWHNEEDLSPIINVTDTGRLTFYIIEVLYTIRFYTILCIKCVFSSMYLGYK